MDTEENKKVVFETDNWRAESFARSTSRSGIIGIVIKLSGGRIKNDKQANVVLVVISVFIFIVSIFVFIQIFRSSVVVPTDTPIPAGSDDPNYYI